MKLGEAYQEMMEYYADTFSCDKERVIWIANTIINKKERGIGFDILGAHVIIYVLQFLHLKFVYRTEDTEQLLFLFYLMKATM